MIEDTKRAARKLLLRAVITPLEAAKIAGVTRQAARLWLKSQGVNWTEQRSKLVERELNREIKT